MKHASGKKKTAVAAAPKAKKSLPKSSAKTVKTVVRKAVILTAPSKSKKKKTTISIAESKNATNKSSAAGKVAGKKAKPVVEKTRQISTRAVKITKPKVSAKKVGTASELKKTYAVKKTKSAASKTIVPVKKNSRQQQTTVVIKKSKTAKIQQIASAAKKSKSVKSTVKPAISVRGKIENAPAKKSAKAQPSVLTEETKIERRKIKRAIVVKPTKIERAVKAESEMPGEKIFAAIKIRRQKIDFSSKKPRFAADKSQPSGNGKASKIRSENKDTAVVNKIEALESAVVQKPKKRKAKAIGAAIFRGRKERYGFQVFPLDSEFDAMASVSGIYVISKRKTDRNKRAHHALVCIGQTDSVAGEIKRHAKKCIKKHQANVISILSEPSEKKRLKIEEDLKAAHSIACSVE